MEDNKKLDININEAVEYTEEEMKKLQDEDLKGVSGGAAEEVAAAVINWDLTGNDGGLRTHCENKHLD